MNREVVQKVLWGIPYYLKKDGNFVRLYVRYFLEERSILPIILLFITVNYIQQDYD